MTSEVSFKPVHHGVMPPPGLLMEWTEEVRFWKQEASAFLRLAAISKLACRTSERATLEKVTVELAQLCTVGFPELERMLEQPDQSPEAAVAESPNDRLEEMMAANRRVYRRLKSRLLPFLTILIKAGIW